MDKENPTNYSKIMPLIDDMQRFLNSSESESDKLTIDKAKTILLRSKGLVIAWFSPEQLTQVLEESEKLHQAHADDFLITKEFVKTLVGYCLLRLTPSLLNRFEPFELKPYLEKARTANSILINKHSFGKCTPHIDVYEIRMCDFYLSNDAFGRLSRKYLARTVDPKW